jgi:sodium/hydrogen antiporter
VRSHRRELIVGTAAAIAVGAVSVLVPVSAASPRTAALETVARVVAVGIPVAVGAGDVETPGVRAFRLEVAAPGDEGQLLLGPYATAAAAPPPPSRHPWPQGGDSDSRPPGCHRLPTRRAAGWWTAEALVLAVLLAPTDAALGQAVVTEPRLPLRVRQGLNVESGLNDGICVPLLLIVLAAADLDAHATTSHHAVTVVLEEIGYGVVGGVAAGVVAAAIVVVAGRRGWVADMWLRLIPVAAAVLAYGIADPLGGSGFIAAFVAGLCYGRLVGSQAEGIAGFNEQLGELLNGVTFIAFGAVLLGPALGEMTWSVALYAVLSLTVVRLVPVAVALARSHARPETVGFVGWFGPRGLASIVFAILVLQEAQPPHTDTILLATYTTIGLSVLLHGLSAAPLARRYARWYEAHRRSPMESRPVAHQRPHGAVASDPVTAP